MDNSGNYILYQGNEQLSEFASEYYTNNPDRPAVFFVGKGFDPRMNNALRSYLQNNHAKQVKCYVVGYESERPSKYQKLIDENYDEFKQLSKQYGVVVDENSVVENYDDKSSAIIGFFYKILRLHIDDGTDIYVDISAMPRALYYTILKALYKQSATNKTYNLFVYATENTKIDNSIQELEWTTIDPLWGFTGNKIRENVLESIRVLIPLIGEDKSNCLKKIISENEYDDVCPILPFPSKDPHRSEQLLWEYSGLFSNELDIEEQNIAYAHEQNPFELRLIISEIINNYTKAFHGHYPILFDIALLTSKLLSLGAFLIAVDNQNVAILNVNPQDYQIRDGVTMEKFKQLNNDSETFLLWVSGEAYEDYEEKLTNQDSCIKVKTSI